MNADNAILVCVTTGLILWFTGTMWDVPLAVAIGVTCSYSFLLIPAGWAVVTGTRLAVQFCWKFLERRR